MNKMLDKHDSEKNITLRITFILIGLFILDIRFQD